MTFDFETESHNVTDAVIYCRVSSKAQVARGDGLQGQQTRCEAYAKYKGYNVVTDAFVDDLSGRKSNRPGMSELFEFLHEHSAKGKQHVVIVDDLTRFARKVKVHFEFRAAIAEAGGILETPSMELRDDADGELHEHILASVAQHQSRKNAEQSQNRMKARLLNGYWVFHKPKGFVYKTVKGRGKMLFHDEPVAGILKEALEGFASGRYASQSEFKRHLESQPAFPKDLPNGEIRYQNIIRYLTQPLYAGYLEVPNWGISFRKAQNTGIISLATYQKIQDRLAQPNKAPARKDISKDFILRNHVLCGDCDRPLTAGWSKSKTGAKHPYYRCYNKACASHQKSIRRDKMEGEFETILKAMQPSEALFNFSHAMMKDAWQQRLSQLNEITAKLKIDLKSIEKQTKSLVDRIVETSDIRVIRAYENKISEMDKNKLLITEKLANKEQTPHSFDESFELSMKFLANPHRLWASRHIHMQQIVLRLGFEGRLTYHREKGFLNPEKALPFSMLEGLSTPSKNMVLRAGLEPARLSSLPPQDSVSTNSTT